MCRLHALTVALLALLSLGASVADLPESEPLARVNGQEITAGELERFMTLQGSRKAPPAGSSLTQAEFEAAMARDALGALIERRLLLEAARRDSGDSEAMRAALDDLAERELRRLEERAGSRLRARQLLADEGLTVEQFKEYQIETMLITRLMYQKVFNRVAVKPSELRQYYDAHPEEFRLPRTLVYRQILLTVSDADQQVAHRAEAEHIIQQLRAGADFGRLADRFSADRDRYPGGLHRVELPEDQADWRPAVLEGLEPGQTSDVRELAGSLSIVRFEQIVEPRTLTFAEAQSSIRTRLLEQKRADAQAAFVEDLKSRARIEYLEGAARLGILVPTPNE